eukprot:11158739-Lingulodinium_polyedra.AAC.1
MGQDAIHPRQVAMLDDPLLDLCGRVFAVGGQWAILPSSTLRVLMALLEKPTGGLRTIGVFASYYR